MYFSLNLKLSHTFISSVILFLPPRVLSLAAGKASIAWSFLKLSRTSNPKLLLFLTSFISFSFFLLKIE